MRAICATMLGVLCLWSAVCAQSAEVRTGRVLDARGNPVSGAQVYYYPNPMLVWFGVPPNSLPHTTTDEKGYYRLTNIAFPHTPLTTIIAFHPQLGCSIAYQWAKLPRDLRLQPLKEFRGKVVNTEGRPIANAQVRLLYIGIGDDGIFAPSVPPFVAFTDAEGAFRLPTHPQMRGLAVICTAPGYEPLYYTTNTTWDKLSKEGMKLTLKPGARITAQLVYAHNGEPVRGYPVTVSPIHAAYTTTDENGRITLDVVADSVTLMPGILLSSPTLVPPGFFSPVQVKNLQPGTTVDLGVIKVYTEPVVTVEVRDEKEKPVPFCGVSIVPAADRNLRDSPSYLTDARGQLTIPLPDGEYLLNAWGPASEDIYYSSRGEYRLSVEKGKVAGSQPVVLNVTTSRMARTERMKMRVRTSRNQIPKNIWAQFGSAMFDDIEDGENRWRPYRMEGDTLTVELSVPDRRRVDRLIILDAGTQEGAVLRDLSVQNPPKLVRLRPLPRATGRVLDAAGKPVVGAKVSLMFGRASVDRFSDGTTQGIWLEFLTPLSAGTDKAGRFVLPIVPEGKCWAIATAKGYEPAAAPISKGQTVTIRLQRASKDYIGVLVDEYGEPIAKTRLALRYSFPNSLTPQNYRQHRVPTREIPLGSVTTDDAGRFTLKGMPSALILVPRLQNLPLGQIRVTPSRDLVLTISTPRPPWERGREPVTPNVEKLLRSVEWLQPIQWQDRNTLLVFTAPYLAQNEPLSQTVKQQLREGWQMAVVFDTTNKQEAERYCQQIGLDVPVGYWKRSATRPIAPALPRILPSLPYVVHIGQDGKPRRHGIATGEISKLVGALP